MKKFSKVLSVLTALAVTMSIAACGKKEPVKETTSPTPTTSAEAEVNLDDIIPKETVTLNVYSQLANYSGEQIGWFAKVMKDKFNVKLNIIKQADGVFATRMESGDLGDIVIFGNDGDEYQQAIAGNALYKWEQDNLLQDYGSYILKNMQIALEKNKALSKGTIYGFGHNVGSSTTEHEAFFYKPDIRWDLYKQLGYPEVNTLEDFVKVLGDMQKLAPKSDTGSKTYGVSLFPDWDGNMVMTVKSTAALYGYDEFGFGLYNVATGEYQDTLKDGGIYLRCLKFYNTLFQKGLLDPDSMTQTYDDMSEDYKTGAAFWNIFDWMASGTYNTPEHLAQGKAMMALAAKDQKNVAYGLNMNGGNRVWTIGAKTNYPELSMAIINWLATPEGVMVSNYGPQGLTWDYKDGKPYLTELGEACQKNGDTELTGDYTGKWTDGTSKMNNSTWALDAVNPDAKNGDTYNSKFWETRKDQPVTEIEQDWRTKVGASNPTEYLAKSGNITISVGTTYSESAKSNELTTTWNQVKDTIKTYSWKAIYAKTDAEFDSIVKEMRDKANSYGYAECVKYQEGEAAIRKGLEDKVKNK